MKLVYQYHIELYPTNTPDWLNEIEEQEEEEEKKCPTEKEKWRQDDLHPCRRPSLAQDRLSIPGQTASLVYKNTLW